MKDIRWIYLFLGIVFAVGAVLVGRSIYKITHRQKLVTDDGLISEQLKKVREQDLDALKEEKGSESEIAKSLLRFTSQNLPESEEMIKKYLESDSEKLKAAAIEASGAFPWASVKNFAEAMNSKSKELRLAALRGMAKRPDAERILLVEKHGDKSSLSDEEWFYTQLTFMRMTPDTSKKAAILSGVLGRLPEWSEDLQSAARRELYRAMPRVDELKVMARDELSRGNVTKSATQALQYLSAFDREKLKEDFASLPLRDDYVYQLAMIDFMALACPKDWSVVSGRLRERPNAPDIVRHLDEADLGVKCRLGL